LLRKEDMNFDIAQLLAHFVIYMVVWLFAVSIHEAAHAWTSHRWGDDTAYLRGRVTLNPIAHIDPFGTLLFPALGFIAGWYGGGGGAFAWGKPTPVNPLRWTDKKWGNICTSVAGVVMNFTIVVVVFVILKVLFVTNTVDPQYFIDTVSREPGVQLTWISPLLIFLYYSLTLNLALTIFNLIPIPPLDGGSIFSSLLGYDDHPIFAMLEQYGFMLLLIMMMTGIASYIMMPFFKLLFILLFLYQ
jgi:Zn-dependent protease